MNLVVNARDAMPGGGVITVAAREETLATADPIGLKPGRYICISVADTGTGMDGPTLERAMEPFFTTKGVGKGTGLGLSMVHGLAEQSGGRLRLHSRVGEGTTVEMWLPVALDGVGGAVRDGGPGAPPASPDQTPLRILVVDDDSLVLMNTRAFLEDLGHTVIEADSGQKALRLLVTDPTLNLLITDQAMPELTGLQLAEAVRAHRPDLPIILATGYAELPTDADPGLLRLSKPFTQADLTQAVATAFKT